MKTKDLQLLVECQSDENIKFKFLSGFIIELTDLDWCDVFPLLKEFGFKLFLYSISVPLV